MGRAVVERPPIPGEAVVVGRDRLVEVEPEVEGRAVRVREAGEPGPDAPSAVDLLAEPLQQGPANRPLVPGRHPFGQRSAGDLP